MSPEITPVTVLWHSNFPGVGTGYGTQTRQVVERMKRDGHHVAVNCNYGIQGFRTEWEGIPIFPVGVEVYSNDTVQPNYKEWTKEHPGPSIAVCLFDAWTMTEKFWEGVPTAVWTMVDHMPVPPNVLATLQRPNMTAIAVTRFGQREIERAGVEALYIPMAIDTGLYRPGATYEGRTGRELINFEEDHFVVGCINANKAAGAGSIHRKAWAENILAFSIFAQDKPDARLYLHTERYGRHNGLVLDLLLKSCGLKEGRHYKFVGQNAMHNGIPNEAMAAVYNGVDVLLAPTLGEGFGLTVLEAQSAGLLAIVNNFSAQPEMVGDGWLTEGQPLWDGSQMSWFNTPNIPSIVDALEQAYMRGRVRSDKAREHALQYDADLVWHQYWQPYMERIAKEAQAPTASMPSRSWRKESGSHVPRLTIYVPTYKREALLNLLADLAPQLTPECELIISDDDPMGEHLERAQEILAGVPCRVEYQHHGINLGGDPNIFRGLEQGSGDWVWLIGDDDRILPNAIDDILVEISTQDFDRLILLTPEANSPAAGNLGTVSEIHDTDPGLLVAATLITANVVRRSALDLEKGRERIPYLYGHSWANASCRRIKVMAQPAFRVGVANEGDFIRRSERKPSTQAAITEWVRLLEQGYGVECNLDRVWNFVQRANRA